MVAPWWLLGLLLLPLIRWLHRGGAQRRAVVVAHLGLWSPTPQASTAPQPKSPPDPAWRRRAALVALLCMALAGPRWPAAPAARVLWVDDSPSLLVREDGGTRLAMGLAAARDAIAGQGGVVQVRRLSDPWQDLATALGLDAALEARLVAAITARAAGSPLDGAAPPGAAAPPAALLERDPAARHWLLSDGARGAATWPGGRAPDHVISVGRKDRNIGLVLLSARARAGADNPGLDLLVGVHNGGGRVESRGVELQGPAGALQRLAVTLQPGQTQWLSMTVPAQQPLRAQLLPADDLPEDDVLSLDTQRLQPAVLAVDPRCPAALTAAVAVHPGLVAPSADRSAQAGLACGPDSAAPADLPLLRLPLEGEARRLGGPWQTAPDWRDLPLPTDPMARLPVRGRLALQPGDEVALAAGGEALLVQRSTPRQLLSAVDLAGWSPDPAAALWLNRMLERMLGRALLDSAVQVGRSEASVQVVPRALSASAASRDGVPPAAGEMPASSAARLALLLAAIALLALELLWMLQQRRRLLGAWSASPQPGTGAET